MVMDPQGYKGTISLVLIKVNEGMDFMEGCTYNIRIYYTVCCNNVLQRIQ